MPAGEAARCDILLRNGDATDSAAACAIERPSEPVFDDLVRLACQVCRTPVALLSFVDEDGESVVASTGWPVNDDPIPPSHSPATHVLNAIAQEPVPKSLFVIPDAREDARFSGSPFVFGPPSLRFYAAVPLYGPGGEPCGTLAVADDTPRFLDDRQASALASLARQAMALLELRQQVGDLQLLAARSAHSEESAIRRAHHDDLTGLPNRVYFLDRLAVALAECGFSSSRWTGLIDGDTGRTGDPKIDAIVARKRKKPKSDGLAVLFVDLDRFKRINDTLGHAAGDNLLRDVSARFAACLRPEDVIARYAGDEFTVLLPNLSSGGAAYAESVARMLIGTLRRPVVLGGREYHIGASVGIALAPQDGDDAQTLIKHADIAMYEAKSRGGYAAYSRRMDADGYQRLVAEGELRRAIEAGALDLAYQPQVDLGTGAIIGVEALCRWRHPERGQVPPAHFIQIAEQADLIVPLGEFVLRRACEDAVRWRAEGHPELRVAVNVSARQLSQQNFIETVTDALEKSGLPGEALDLELTETALCASGDGTPKILQELRALGVRLLVDDFGTGYSSLVYLRQFPVDILKIDRAFVAGLGQGTIDDALVRALIEMARALSLRVVAEGVETELQLERLKDMGCDYAQGYLFSRPTSIDQLRSLLAVNLPGRRRASRVTGGASVRLPSSLIASLRNNRPAAQ